MKKKVLFKRLADSYVKVATRLGLSDFCQVDEDIDKTRDSVSKDIDRTPFIGTETDHQLFRQQWLNLMVASYTQGDMDCGIFTKLPFDYQYHNLKAKDPSNYSKLFAENTLSIFNMRFGFVDHNKHICGCSFVVLKNYPQYWLFGIIQNGTNELKDRQVYLYASPAEELKLSNTVSFQPNQEDDNVLDQTVSYPLFIALLTKEINHPQISTFMTKLFYPNGAINMSLLDCIDPKAGRFTTPESILDGLYNEDTLLTQLCKRILIGCMAYLESHQSRLPHNKNVRIKIQKLQMLLQHDPKSNLQTLANYLEYNQEIDINISATSCLLRSLIRDDLLRYVFELTTYDEAMLIDSKSNRQKCLDLVRTGMKKLFTVNQPDNKEAATLKW